MTARGREFLFAREARGERGDALSDVAPRARSARDGARDESEGINSVLIRSVSRVARGEPGGVAVAARARGVQGLLEGTDVILEY